MDLTLEEQQSSAKKQFGFDLSRCATVSPDKTAVSDDDQEVSFKKNPFYEKTGADRLAESDEVKLLAQVVSDLNSHPVVILGHDRLTEDEVKLFSGKL